MDVGTDQIAAPGQMEDDQLSARAVLPVLGWNQVWGRIAQQAGVDAVQDQGVVMRCGAPANGLSRLYGITDGGELWVGKVVLLSYQRRIAIRRICTSC